MLVGWAHEWDGECCLSSGHSPALSGRLAPSWLSWLWRDEMTKTQDVTCLVRGASRCGWIFWSSSHCSGDVELGQKLPKSEFLKKIFFKDFIYFLEKEEGREKEMERNISQLPLTQPQLGTWPAAQACALTGNRTGNLSVHRLALNPLSYTSQD